MNSKIVDSWSLIDFAKAHGKMSMGDCVNHQTGEVFKACSFSHGGNTTFVSFSSKMGVLQPNEIVTQKADLQVVKLESGSYILCKKGNTTWQEITL